MCVCVCVCVCSVYRRKKEKCSEVLVLYGNVCMIRQRVDDNDKLNNEPGQVLLPIIVIMGPQQ